jgi:hypothetical protein
MACDYGMYVEIRKYVPGGDGHAFAEVAEGRKWTHAPGRRATAFTFQASSGTALRVWAPEPVAASVVRLLERVSPAD